jgi:hypothetical protein
VAIKYDVQRLRFISCSALLKAVQNRAAADSASSLLPLYRAPAAASQLAAKSKHFFLQFGKEFFLRYGREFFHGKVSAAGAQVGRY